MTNRQGLTGGQTALIGLAQFTIFGCRDDPCSTGFYYLFAGCLTVALEIGVYLIPPPRLPLLDEHFNLPQLREYLLWLVSLRCHSDPPFS